MIDELKKSTEAKMKKSVEAFKVDLSKVRTGRAHTGLLDHVMVDYYGTPTAINQVAKVTLIDARTIGVQPWEKGMGPKLEKAIRESDLGLNPASQGDLIRVPMPALTEERRRELTKLGKGEGEDAKVAVRNLRRDANDHAKRLGYEEAAVKIQDAFLAGRRDEAMAAIPDKLIDEIALIGPPDRIKGRLKEWKAAGKGGAIKLMVNHLDPRHYRVVSYGAPSRQEKEHHFLWRFYTELPGLGHMAVFDRSWYGRVLVERIEGFCSRDEWRRAYKAIVDFEESLCTESTILVKMYMHISDDEQLARFESRGADPLKQWKLTDEDWRNREKNREYEKAANEMFERTDHKLAPWDLISGEQKRWARVEAIETLIRRVEEGMSRWGIEVPEPF